MATSGMLVGGPSVEYFKHLAPDKKNGMVFTSYLGPGSLGRQIQRGVKDVTLDNGEKIKIALDVTAESFTNHAGRNELMDFVKKMKPRPRKIIVVHGEAARPLELASALHKTYRVETVAPKNLESIRLR